MTNKYLYELDQALDPAAIITSASGVTLTGSQTLTNKTLTSPVLTSPTVNTSQTMGEAANVVLGTTTGTKIGTATGQKLGFWNATPVAQQVFATGASHTVDELITVLQTLGLVKQA